MTRFAERIRPHVDRELSAAWSSYEAGDARQAFGHLERAHVLGQASTSQHVRVHVHMLRWAWRQGAWHELRGQLVRIVGAATKTALGWIPSGNTGGANVSPFRPLPVATDLAEAISRAKSRI
jgi:hypothetical protein